METVNVGEAKMHLSKLLERVRAGEEICILHHEEREAGSAARSPRAAAAKGAGFT